MPLRVRTRGFLAAALVVTSLACYSAPVVPSTPEPPPMLSAQDENYVAAPADSCARAQRRAEQQPVFKVMREASPYRSNTQPPYPLRERQNRYQRVTVKFLVTPSGVVDTSRVRFIASSGPRFNASVLEVLPTWRFHPAELVPGCRVWFEVTMPVEFFVPPLRNGN